MSVSKTKIETGPKIAYEDTGGSGVPIIFSHGLFMDHTMFEPQLQEFAKSWRCITWDERAHGETVSSGPFNYWDSARDLLALMDALNIDRAIHCGMSQGGLLGMRAAILSPKRFPGIIQLSSQAGKLADEEEGMKMFRGIMERWIENGISDETREFLTGLILGPGVDTRYWHTYWARLTPPQIEGALSALYSIDELYDRLHEVVVPTLNIHGTADVSTPHELAERVHQGLPDSRGLALIEGGHHANNLSHPEQVNAAIQRFLDELVSEDASLRA